MPARSDGEIFEGEPTIEMNPIDVSGDSLDHEESARLRLPTKDFTRSSSSHTWTEDGPHLDTEVPFAD